MRHTICDLHDNRPDSAQFAVTRITAQRYRRVSFWNESDQRSARKLFQSHLNWNTVTPECDVERRLLILWWS